MTPEICAKYLKVGNTAKDYFYSVATEYNTQLKHIQEHDRQFFSGVDVENLRSLCRLVCF
jgi:hypothetical protein